MEGSVDDGDDGVPARLGAAKAVRRDENRLVEGEEIGNHSFLLEPPIGPFPPGNDEEGVSVVLADFLHDSVEERPVWVDMDVDEFPAGANTLHPRALVSMGPAVK